MSDSMNIKKHYKIFISIMLIIVLISTFIIYDISNNCLNFGVTDQ